MRWRRWRSLIVAVILPAAAGVARGAEADGSASFDKDVRPVVLDNCVACHNPEKKKGDLDLKQFETAAQAKTDEQAWQDVADRLRNGDMPPKKARRRPTDEQRKMVLAWIDRHIAHAEPDCHKIASDATTQWYKGYVMSRRLTRAEYDNTIRDLVGLDLHLARLLPADGGGGEGFDTDGDALFVSAISMEKYLQAANEVMRAVLPDPTDNAPSPAVRSAQDRLLIVRPGPEVPQRDAARRVIDGFARRAFRRPVDEAEIDRFVALFDRARERGQSYEASLRYVLKGVLISPNFLFLAEPAPAQDGSYRLGDYPIASRLSYFLWSSMPDDELFALAGQGRLHDPPVLRAQVRRMLADPRSVALAENFGTQWLGITALNGATRPDGSRFPQFDDALADAERQEVIRFVDSVVREDRPLTELLDANYTFVNEPLAKLYGIEGVGGPEMRRVELPDRNRGGVLGMAAMLTVTSYPLRTSPVLRGKWVLEQLLGERIPPPPPTAGQLPPDDRQHDGLTFRQRLEQHRANPECASCHAKMDPIGFGLENFDAIGRWRTSESSGDPLDARGVLSDGTTFSGPAELKAVLLRRKGQFLANLSRKMLGYALGRGLDRFDQCVLNDAAKALDANGDRPSALIETIVLSTPFQYRYVKR